jgi:hypothetical protein
LDAAADVRRDAAVDRRASHQDRRDAARDRQASSGDRDSAASDRAQAEVDAQLIRDEIHEPSEAATQELLDD